MRAIAGLVLVAALFATLVVIPLALLRWFERQEQNEVAAPGELEAQRFALEAIRHLDRALGDPMYRQSSEWEDGARRLVDGYYGTKGLKR